MAQTRNYLPPYVAFRTFLSLLEELAQHGVPRKLDRDTLDRFVSRGVTGQMLSALRFLQLVEHDGTTRPEIERVVDRAARTDALLRQLELTYGHTFESLTGNNSRFPQADRAFRETLGVTSEATRKNAIRFFSQALDYCGISNKLIEQNRIVGHGSPPLESADAGIEGRSSRENGFSPNQQRYDTNIPTSQQSESVDLNSGGTVKLMVDTNLLGLSREDREFVFALVDQFHEYKEKISRAGTNNHESE